MSEAFEIGVTLALGDGVSEGMARARRDVAQLEEVLKTGGVSVQQLRATSVAALAASNAAVVGQKAVRVERAAGQPEAAPSGVEVAAAAAQPDVREAAAVVSAQPAAGPGLTVMAVPPPVRVERVERAAAPAGVRVPEVDAAAVTARVAAPEARVAAEPVRAAAVVEPAMAPGPAPAAPAMLQAPAAPAAAPVAPASMTVAVPLTVWPQGPAGAVAGGDEAAVWSGGPGVLPPAGPAAAPDRAVGGAPPLPEVRAPVVPDVSVAAAPRVAAPATPSPSAPVAARAVGPGWQTEASLPWQAPEPSGAAAGLGFVGQRNAGAEGGDAAPAPSTPPAGAAASSKPVEGDVFLDGMLVGRWMSRFLTQEASRASAGPTGYDSRRGRLLPGATVGG